jgi:hypothetical protein
MLYAQDKWAVLLIFQAMDAAGKDGAIKHVMSGLNPQGCQVYSFKALLPKSWTMTISGVARSVSPIVATSGSSTAATTRKLSLFAYIRGCSRTAIFIVTGAIASRDSSIPAEARAAATGVEDTAGAVGLAVVAVGVVGVEAAGAGGWWLAQVTSSLRLKCFPPGQQKSSD